MGAFTTFLKGKMNRKALSEMSEKNPNLSPIGIAMAVGTAPLSYSAYQDEGMSSGGAFLRTAAETVGWTVAEPLMWGITLAEGAGTLAQLGMQEIHENAQAKREHAAQISNVNGINQGIFGGNFQDSDQAYTLRQRQMNLLRQHRMATETILGSEARQLHR